MTNAPNKLNERHGWGIRSTDQLTAAVITVIAIAVLVASWIYRGGLRGRLIDIEAAAPVTVTFQLDVNRADWPEWTLLPGVGEKLAKRIVQSRQEQGPFRSHAELLRVNGVGPRTLERISPYLLPLNPDQDRTDPDVAAHP